jgi:hypothetical protein
MHHRYLSWLARSDDESLHERLTGNDLQFAYPPGGSEVNGEEEPISQAFIPAYSKESLTNRGELS